MSRSKPLAVYVIGSDAGPQKIGITDNIQRRLSYLQTGKPERLRVADYRERSQGDARLVERAAHMLLADKRAGGEWFHVSLEEAISAITQGISLVESGSITERKSPPFIKGEILCIRLSPETQDALERAAKADYRPLSSMIRKIVEEWLRKKGKLK